MADDNRIVHIIDDDELLLETIELVFDSVGIPHRGYGSAETFIQSYSPETFRTMAGCLVCDIRMPGVSGMECQRILNQYDSALPIIFVTGFADVKMAVEAMQEGAFDFVEKPFRHQTLIDTVHRALNQNAEMIVKNQAGEQVKALIGSLSPREYSVMELMLEGLPNKKISTALNISLRTVEVHRAHVLEKMACKNVTGLVRKVLLTDLPRNEV